MATKFDKLDKQLDRLEKLFSRRKRSADPHDAVAVNKKPMTPIPSLMVVDTPSPTFPQPSFIRPTSSRMMAREEVSFKPHATRRSKSLPEPTNLTSRVVTTSEAGDSMGNILAVPSRYASTSPGDPQRCSSVYPDSSHSDPSSALLDFSFTASKGFNEDSSTHRRPRSSSKSLSRSASVSVSPKAQVDRKRHSAAAQLEQLSTMRREMDSKADSAQDRKSRHSALLQRESRCLGTPGGENPALAPPRHTSLPGPCPNELVNSNSSASRRPLSLTIPITNDKRASGIPRRSTSLSKLPRTKIPGPDLKEPSLNDFLALSDDDIADGHGSLRAQAPASKPPAVALPPNPSLVSTPVRTEPAHPLLTLSPPLASRPAAAAAIEAARIAAKYRLDLVYVVNLWPSHIARLSRSSPISRSCGTPVATSPTQAAANFMPSPPGSPLSHASGYDSSFESRPAGDARGSLRGGITGRLLAAYGLPSITYPFRISAPVHQKVLRTQGWLEYRNESGAHDEFARGYSCSFYTGYSPARARQGAGADGGDGKRINHTVNNRNKPPNRGIVFAAFRLPDERGMPICSDAEELEALHKDAEALVDMLIEIHMSQRQQRTPTGTPRRRCVTGPGGRLVKPTTALVAS